MPVKTPTAWRPPSGQGYAVLTGVEKITDNAGNFIVDNLGNYLVTNLGYIKPKNPTNWTQVG